LKDAANDSSYTTDILGRARSIPDIGAFEYPVPADVLMAQACF